MKHLKLFENQNDYVYIAVIIPINGDHLIDNTVPHAFETKDDMENFI